MCIKSLAASVGQCSTKIDRSKLETEKYMEIEKVILSTIAILGTLIAFKFKGIWHKLISVGLTISALLFLFTSSRFFVENSFVVITLLAIATLVYGLAIKNLNGFEKISITTVGIFLVVRSIFKLMLFPFAGEIKLSMIIPTIITLVLFIKGKKITKEMSFMIFWLFYTTLEFLRLWTY